MVQDLRSDPAAMALTRFGLGARPGERVAIGSDARGWLLSQIGPGLTPRPEGDFASPQERLAQFAAYRRAVAEIMRPASAAMDMPAPAGMAETDDDNGIPVEIRQMARETVLRTLEEYFASFRLACATPAGFAERWARFWWNHFAVSISKIAVAPVAGNYERDAIRAHAFGRFEDLLVAAASHPAMLLYLDQAQSVGPDSAVGRRRRETGLNENLAREILELHTVGSDAGYTQDDVTEFARALTGWSLRQPGVPGALYRGAQDLAHGHAFVPLLHQPGARTVMGRRYAAGGREQGLAILADLAAHPATGRRLARKLAIHFHSDDPPDSLIQALARAWADSGGRLDVVARALVDAPEMWAEPAAKLKTPEEFMISSYRALDLVPNRLEPLIPGFQVLGQRPWSPPSPEGWPDEAAAWAAPDAVVKRLVWAQRFAEAVVRDQSPVELAEAALGGRLGPRTATAVARAEDRPEAVALLLMSPEFQRR